MMRQMRAGGGMPGHAGDAGRGRWLQEGQGPGRQSAAARQEEPLAATPPSGPRSRRTRQRPQRRHRPEASPASTRPRSTPACSSKSGSLDELPPAFKDLLGGSRLELTRPPMPRTRLTPDEARRAALAAQGFGRSVGAAQVPVLDGASAGRVDVPGPPVRAITQVVRRLGAVQIDSVNVLSRAHYLPFFSRLGPYDRTRLDAAVGRPPRTLFEYWGHEAALLPVSTHPLMRWRMERAHREAWGGMRRVLRELPGLVDEVAAAVRDLRAVDDHRARTGARPHRAGEARALGLELVERQASRGVPVLVRGHHVRRARQHLPAQVRGDRAGDPARRPRHPHPQQVRRAARAGPDRGPGARGGDPG